MSQGPHITDHPSPNFGQRRNGLKPELIVLHYTAMDSAKAALARLCDPAPEVSAHYLICEKGHIYRLVDESMRAWHAGAGSWQGKSDVNSRSIGIELDNRGSHPFSEPQMAALEQLLPMIMRRWNIPAEGVIGHSDMAPGRKFDPGTRFDWRRLALQGLALWPDQAAALGDWADAAAKIGYDTDNPEAIAAFRARFRPWANGEPDAEDARIALRLTDRPSA
ncbi:N-acetylmuramoyl-L-alanine amidase [Shimia isoporae]|uniref:N-acetylmuramoyl-L-alanine amidase n=1 Tax=Shimia isoporae TaxID=647720 RepID=A0A4R1NUA4_9RHOB|nr:N-acetylmuramoyl-L-alanine amidase [Shimia isoporae]TCL08612.1 N-acetylmuramoyl-L-alanine amidase [Shimia isoporae]